MQKLDKEYNEKIKKINNIKEKRLKASREKERLQQRLLDSSIENKNRLERKIKDLNNQLNEFNNEQKKFDELENKESEEQNIK